MEPTAPPSTASFEAKTPEEKCISYMWYIHVLIAVNTEARLRANIAPHLDTPPPADDNSLLLTDYLVLWLFNHTILTRLVQESAVFAQADGYAYILADLVPAALREAFCRRLYTVLFAKGILEWPRGIDMPQPAIPAADVAAGGVLPNETLYTDDDEYGETTGFDGSMEHERRGDLQEAPAAPRAPASAWMRTPSPSSWDSDEESHMSRGAYFGTASHPLPQNYFGDWEWRSRNRDTVPDGIEVHNPVSGEQQQQQQPVSPFTRPEKQSQGPVRTSELLAGALVLLSLAVGKGIAGFRIPWPERPANLQPSGPRPDALSLTRATWREQAPSPHDAQQGRENPRAPWCGDDMQDRSGGEGKARLWNIVSGPRFGRGRVGMGSMGHAAPGQFIVSNSNLDWDGRSPVAGVPAQRWASGQMAGLAPSAAEPRAMPVRMSVLPPENRQRAW